MTSPNPPRYHLQLLMPDAEIERAAALIRAGRLVAFPTETVYGLGANALDEQAVARIFAVKRRPPTSPLIVHVASIEMAKSLVANWPEAADTLAETFWPGPLTLVLPTARVGTDRVGAERAVTVQAERSSSTSFSHTIPLIVTAGLAAVGLRMPAHPIALALIRAAGVPIAAPSANRFTELSPTTAGHVRASLGADVDHILDGGPCRLGIESTVLSLTGDTPVLLRPGGISRTDLEAKIGPVAAAADLDVTFAGPHPAPGMHLKHYSPRTTLFLSINGKLPEQGDGIYLRHRHAPARTNITVHQMPESALEYAAELYGTLHQADAGNFPWIAVDLPPGTPEWEAIQDRLNRAATK